MKVLGFVVTESMITSIPDLIVVGGIALLIFGPKRLPELAKSLGKGIRDFRNAMEGADEKKTQTPEQLPKLLEGPPEYTQPVRRLEASVFHKGGREESVSHVSSSAKLPATPITVASQNDDLGV